MLKTSNLKISENNTPKIIAEISANHNQSLSKEIELIKTASKFGADFVKIQTYSPECLTLDSERKDFIINNPKSPWHKKKLFDLYKIGETPYEWHKEIFDRAKKNKLIFFSSPFDETAVDFLEKLKVPLYKIASYENNHFPLLKRVAQTKKPIIMSTGFASLKDLKESVKYLKYNGCKQLALLKCTSSYPAQSIDLNLATIKKMREIFKCEVGFSDHSLGIGASITAINNGATIIEKHFTLDKYKGTDGFFSSEFTELKNLNKETEVAMKSNGKIFFGATKTEEKFKKYRRSIYVSKNIHKGEKFSKNNLKVIRPAFGLHPKYYEQILGKVSKKKLKAGSPLKKIQIKN